MITMIFGLPRVGKTAFLTRCALEHMTGTQAHQDLKQSQKLVSVLNANGFCYDLPREHMVFSDYYIEARHGKVISHEIDGFKLGLPDAQHDTIFLPPYARIYLDEAQKYYNSREKGLSDFVSRFYELSGHYGIDVTIAMQRPKLIDLNIRELAMQVIEIKELRHEYEHGRIIRSAWYCNLLDNAALAQQYIEGGKVKKLGQAVKYTFEGNIFKHYNSRNFMPSFLNGREEKQFEIVSAIKSGYTPESVRAFNARHGYTVPETYYKKRGRK